MARNTAPLPIPALFDGKRAADYAYRPDAQKVAADAQDFRAKHALKPAASDETRVHLLLIDVQKDFCFPEGSLYVAGRSGTGAIDDSRRIAEMIYRNLGAITDITTTLDTHLAYQIFFPSFWLDKTDAPLTPYRVRSLRPLANFDLTAAREALSWTPAIGVHRGLERTFGRS